MLQSPTSFKGLAATRMSHGPNTHDTKSYRLSSAFEPAGQPHQVIGIISMRNLPSCPEARLAQHYSNYVSIA